MPQIRFRCAITTPMFLGGAFPNERKPEIRAASINGCLRYWYRVLLGGRGVTDLEALREREAAIFGGTDRASALQIRASELKTLQVQPPGNLPSRSGIQYLWHFTDAGDNDRYWFQCSENSIFTVTLRSLPRAGAGLTPVDVLQEAVGAFWLLTTLGGLGLRSRRFAGNFKVQSVEAPDQLRLPAFQPSAKESIPAWLKRQFEHLRFPDNNSGNRNAKMTPFPSLRTANIWHSLKHGTTWKEIVDSVGQAYKSYRKGAPNTTRVSFGLPLEDVTVTVRSGGKHTEMKRRASPLWMSTVADSDGSLLAIFTSFEGPFAPRHDALQVGGGSFRSSIPSKASSFLESIGADRIHN